MKDFTIPSECLYIDDDVFAKSSNIESIFLSPQTNRYGNNVFRNCISLSTLYFASNNNWINYTNSVLSNYKYEDSRLYYAQYIYVMDDEGNYIKLN